MTASIFTRFFRSLACQTARPGETNPPHEDPPARDAAAPRRLISTAGHSSLYELCLDIERGYDSGKCMYDSGMTSLAETLTTSTGEIKHLIEQLAQARARA